MDSKILKSKNVVPRNPRRSFVQDYVLRIGKMATLLRKKGASVHGMLYSLTHHEVHTLYQGSGLGCYVPEAVMVQLESGERVAAITCNLLSPPDSDEENLEYYHKLSACMDSLGLPMHLA